MQENYERLVSKIELMSSLSYCCDIILLYRCYHNDSIKKACLRLISLHCIKPFSENFTGCRPV